VAPTTTDVVNDIRATSANVGAEFRLQSAELQDYITATEHSELGDVLPATDVQTLSQAIENERSVDIRVLVLYLVDDFLSVSQEKKINAIVKHEFWSTLLQLCFCINLE